ncbi:MAG: hypothetical protein ACI90V_010933 [Bacillariaceae sp.]|jgi:hypothetical protein
MAQACVYVYMSHQQRIIRDDHIIGGYSTLICRYYDVGTMAVGKEES